MISAGERVAALAGGRILFSRDTTPEQRPAAGELVFGGLS